MRNRTIITNVKPALEGGKFLIKRVPGEEVNVSADIYCDGDDSIRASILYKKSDEKKWSEAPLQHVDGESWEGVFKVASEGIYHYKIEAWIDHLASWYNNFKRKFGIGQHLGNELTLGVHWLKKAAAQAGKTSAGLINTWIKILENENLYHDAVNLVLSEEFESVISTCYLKQFPTVFDQNLKVRVGRPKELFSTWYLMFPRSASDEPGKHGTLQDCEKRLPRLAAMGFDTLLLPPIFPIGETNRKGKNNALVAEPGDVGSPWSAGSKDGGHKTVHPKLGTIQDFENLVKSATSLGIELALDLSLRCSLDHPYIKEHPDWFNQSPDGKLLVEEVPPLNYMDIVDFNFECDDWENLWSELKSVFLFWAEKGVRIFYASTPHHKPFAFWQWVIQEVQNKYPDAIFFSGAFTRRVIREELAKSGFNQSISNFIWKNTVKELQDYLIEVTQSETKEYLHPNFFTNTPDILPSYLADAGPNAFMLRYALAATLSSNCGIYGPAFELMANQRYPGSKERYLHSEKYEIQHFNWNEHNRLTDFITRLNRIRKDIPAFHNTFDIHFTNTDNEKFLGFVKASIDKKSLIWCIINMDTQNRQTGHVEVPKAQFGLKGSWFNLKVTDLLTGEVYHWFNDWNFVELNPERYPLHVLKVEME
jgi:starch synthase (maltosyl-transferring)